MTDELDVLDDLVKRYYPALLDTVHACLAVFGAMSFAGRTNPVSLILEGPSGYGKTAVVKMFFPEEDSPMDEFVYRSDKFTPRAFVSHATNMKKKQLDEIDLLPKIENKILLTKELAPLFRGREDEIKDNFAMLIPVLDGDGFTSDTGAQGNRGYRRKILFNWIGCTTPLPPSMHQIMSQLGTRLLFYEVPSKPPSTQDLVDYGLLEHRNQAEVECHDAVNSFILTLYAAHPIGTVPLNTVVITPPQMHVLVRWAQFLVEARAELKHEKDGSNWVVSGVNPPEGAWKVLNYLMDLVRGHALVCGRDHADGSDLKIVSRVATSSAPGHLRPLIRSIGRGDIDTEQAMKLCAVSRPTAIRYLREMETLKLANGIESHRAGEVGRPSFSISLADKYEWMRRNGNRPSLSPDKHF